MPIMKCPSCKSSYDVIPIQYGFIIPNPEEDKGKGEYILGGCTITGNQASMYCKSCNIYFDHRGKLYEHDEHMPMIYGTRV
jgi:hypothetical protein